MDWLTAILSGLFTGIGVILATRLMNWLDKHPIMKRFKEKFNNVTGSDEDSLHDLMQKQRDLGKRIEDKISGVKKHRPRF